MRLSGKIRFAIAGVALIVALSMITACKGKATTTSAKPTTTAVATTTAATTTAATTSATSKPATTVTAITTTTTVPVAGYGNPDMLVETTWLSQHLTDAGLRIVDVRTRENYLKGHIQGAVSLPVAETFDPADLNKADVGSVAQLEKAFGDRGIGADTRVIIYDGGRETLAGRLFWTLEYAGHTKAAYLNGGFTKWQKESLPVATEETKASPAKFTVSIKALTLATKADVLAAVGKPGNTFVDTRTTAEFKGDDLRAKRGGHIPGAVNIEWTTQLTSGDVPVLKSAAELKKMYEDVGVTRDKTAYVY